jgi:hypothetical protein
MRNVVALVLALSLVGHCGAVWAQAASSADGDKPILHEVASGAATVLYTPLKAGLCVIGGASSALVYLSSGPRAQRAVAGASCGGTWILTPAHLTGKKPINFVAESIPAPAP